MTLVSKKFIKNICFVFLLFLTSCSAGEEDRKSLWQGLSNMNGERFASAVIVVGDNIYAIGGSSKDGYIWDSEWSRFKGGGTLEKWKMAPSLTTPRGYASVVEHNGNIYVLGGANGEHGTNLLDTIERASVNPNGSLSRWVVEKSVMTTPRRGVQAIVSQGYIYAIGGYNGTFLHSVERAKINSDGSLGTWQELTPMIYERYIHSSVTSGGFIYSIGGHKNASGGALSQFEYGKVSSESLDVEWLEGPSLNLARYDAGSVFAEGAIYVAGGYDGSAIDSVEMSVVGSDGVPGRWRVVSTLPDPVHGAMVVYRDGFLYLVGGASKGTVLSTVRVLPLSSFK